MKFIIHPLGLNVYIFFSILKDFFIQFVNYLKGKIVVQFVCLNKVNTILKVLIFMLSFYNAKSNATRKFEMEQNLNICITFRQRPLKTSSNICILGFMIIYFN